MLTVLSVIGTRPEAIKMAPVIEEMGRHPDRIRSVVCVTGQHREMLDQALQVFSLRPDYDLDLMRAGQSLPLLTSQLLDKLDTVVTAVRPDWILAQGDTTSVFVAALISFYHRIPFGHVEAGLRTDDVYSPFPEEVNRRLADVMATLWFAPTERARDTLMREGYRAGDVLLTGNTVVDALHQVLRRDYDWNSGPLAALPRDRRLVLVTLHRRESFGQPLKEICHALRRIAEEFLNQGVHLVWPVHLNPQVREPVLAIMSGLPNVTLLEPLDYLSLIQLMRQATLVLTDSGGIQEEAPSLGVPVLVLRDTTERPEGVEAGVAELVGTSPESITASVSSILGDPGRRALMTAARNPYGDGKAALRIVTALMERSKA